MRTRNSYLDRFPKSARTHVDRAYADGFEDGANDGPEPRRVYVAAHAYGWSDLANPKARRTYSLHIGVMLDEDLRNWRDLDNGATSLGAALVMRKAWAEKLGYPEERGIWGYTGHTRRADAPLELLPTRGKKNVRP